MEPSTFHWHHDPAESRRGLRCYCSKKLSNLSRKLRKPVAQVVSERGGTGQHIEELTGIYRSVRKGNPSRTFITYSCLAYAQTFRNFTYCVGVLQLLLPNKTTYRQYLFN